MCYYVLYTPVEIALSYYKVLVDDLYNKLEEQNRRILALEQELKDLKGEK